MKEIKFRIYSYEGKDMLDWNHLISEPDLPDMLKNANKEDGYYSKLMQYTGLKDRNNKEIYEGDVLNCKHGLVGEVYWVKNMAMWAVCGEALMRNVDGEIIGNIYENPDLV